MRKAAPKRPEWSTGAAPVKSVPKTLGFALCAGCGRKSFFAADGIQLQPCKTCGQVRRGAAAQSSLFWAALCSLYRIRVL